MVEINKIKLQPSDKNEKSKTAFKVISGSDTNRKRPKLWKYILFFLVFLLILAGIAGAVGLLIIKPLYSGIQKTSASGQLFYEAFKKQDLVDAQAKIKETQDNLQKTKKIYDRLGWAKIIPFAGAYVKDGDRVLLSGEAGLSAGQTLIEAITPYADILGFEGQGSFSGGTAEDRVALMMETLPKIMPKIDQMAEDFKTADDQLSQIDPQRYPETFRGKEIRPKIVQVQGLVHDAVLATTDAKPLLEVLPSVMGFPDEKRYLALFQNDGELRATGGFMTAYGVLRVEKGRIRAEKSDDIYSLDEKLKSRLKPPPAISKYLLSADLGTGIVPYFYLRDMNFSPDFKVSMDTFYENYQKIKGEPKVDGIIAMDTKVLTDLLEVLGPIDVPGYGKFTLEPDSRCFDIPQIICELEYIADEPIPGQKVARKDVLGPMMQEIIIKAMGSGKNVWPKLFEVITKDIEEKHILFYFSDPKAEQASELFNAAGRIKDFDGDYLHINDSNFGGAKSNLFIDQEVEKEITNENGKWVSTVTITYTNPVAMSNCNLERKEGLCLNGILRDYLRVYVPEGSKLIEGLGSEEEFETSKDFGKTYFEGFFTLRGEGGRAKIILRYELPDNIKFDKQYQLLIQKQPGTLSPKYKLIVNGEEQEFELTKDMEIKVDLE